MKKYAKKHPKRPRSKLLRIEHIIRWQDFKRKIPFLKYTNVQGYVITYLVDSTTDRSTADILYHEPCWTEHVLRNFNNQLEDPHLQKINIDNARKLVFCQVYELIYIDRENSQLQWLLAIRNLLLAPMD